MLEKKIKRNQKLRECLEENKGYLASKLKNNQYSPMIDVKDDAKNIGYE